MSWGRASSRYEKLNYLTLLLRCNGSSAHYLWWGLILIVKNSLFL